MIADSADRLPLGIKTEILPGYPQADFDSIGATAFAARLKGSPRADMIGLVCNKGFMPRVDAAAAFRPLDKPNLLRLHESGMVTLPGDGGRVFCMTIERPQQPRFLADLDFVRQPMHEENLVRFFVTPMTSLLLDLSGLGHAHGALRLSNIFWREGAATLPQLGEGVSAQSGFGQSVIYETCERMQSPAAQRGPATHLDDCYAFGVVLALLAQGRNPFPGMDDAAIVRAKLEKGSYNALLSNVRVGPSMVELLRGLLADEPKERWRAQDAMMWVTGRRLTPKPAEFGRRATRPLLFAGQEFYSPRVLAAALPQHVPAAAALVDSGEVEKWLRRTVNDEDKADNLLDALDAVNAKGRNARKEDLIVSYACMVLDPSGPIRWRGLTVPPPGFGAALADAVKTNSPHLQSIAEMIGFQLVSFWIELQGDSKTEFVPLAQQLDRMKPLIEKTSYGSGIERVVYELNPNLPCLSPLVQGLNVISGRELLAAMEHSAKRGNKGREPIDRHIAGFLVARDRRSEGTFTSLGQSDDQLGRAITIVKVYADSQSKHGPEQAPELARWLLPILEPAANRYTNRPFRETIRRELRAAAEKGSLSTMLRLVDDAKIVDKDRQEFAAAKKIYAATVNEIRILDAQMKNPTATAAVYGRPAATYVACLIAVGVLIISVIKALTGGG